MILDQSQYAAFAQAGRFGGESVWTYLATVTQVLGLYEVAARELYQTSQRAGQLPVSGTAVGEQAVTGVVAGEVSR